MSSMLMNHYPIVNQVSLNRNTNKTRLCIDWLVNMLLLEAQRNLTMYFLQEQWFGIH